MDRTRKATARLFVVLALTLFGVMPATAQIAFRAGSSATAAGVAPAFRAAASATTTGVTLSITKPVSIVANDVVIASIGVQPSTATITPPAGWTLIRRIDNAAVTSNSLAVYYKVAGASEPTTYDFTLGGSSFTVGGVQGFSNVDTANPIVVEDGQTTASATTHATPSITTLSSNTMVVTSHTFASSRTWSPPSGMSESFDRPSGADNAVGQSIEGARVLQAVAGASGTKTATAAGNADVGATHILGLRPRGVNLTINTPAGTLANDVMIAAVAFNNETAAVTPPVGWTLVRRIENTATTRNALVVYRKTAGVGEPSTQTWVINGGTQLVGGIQSFSGADPANPIDVENGAMTASASVHSTPSVTTTVPNTMLVTAHAFASSQNWTPGAGQTEGFDRRSGGASATGEAVTGTYQAQSAAGSTGAKSATAAGATPDVGAAHILALKPPTAPAQVYYIHPDHLDTPRVITNQAQQVVWRWDNDDPFGNNAPNENPSGLGQFTNNLRMPGQYYDKETNLHYNYFRDYDPAIGRYIQSDPIGLAGGINTYAYVGSNPLSYTDPEGLNPSSGFGFPWQAPPNWTPQPPRAQSQSVPVQVVGATGDFGRNYMNMRNANTIGADKYFHCKANCEAARRGSVGDAMACMISDTREWVDQNIKGNPASASQADQLANSFGRGQGGRTILPCDVACIFYRPNGLPAQY